MSVIPIRMNNSLLMTMDLSRFTCSCGVRFRGHYHVLEWCLLCADSLCIDVSDFQCVFDIRYMIKSTNSLLSEITVYDIIIICLFCVEMLCDDLLKMMVL